MVSKTFHLLSIGYIFLLFADCALQCSPGRSYGMRKARKTTPLVFKQHVPNVSENTLGASGPSEGRITRQDPRFKDLVVNNNPNIVFKDEEGTGVDRIMSQRCKDKLDALAILVKNHWRGVRLRVIEVWDEGGHSPQESLHQEGRAVDITTSDRDRSKYGMLARLAVNAGFDWVYYESRGHIHCSVRSDSSIAVQMGGCFPPSSSLRLQGGATVSMAQLAVGDRVLTVDASGNFQYEPVIGFLHRSPKESASVWIVETENGQTLTLTPDHLIYTSQSATASSVSTAGASFVGRLQPNDSFVFVRGGPGSGDPGERPVPSRVKRVTAGRSVGLYAPLTSSGTVVVDDVVASCYAFFDSHVTAHLVVAPLRLQYYVGEFLRSISSPSSGTTGTVVPDAAEAEGIHWYAQMMYNFGLRIVPAYFWFSSNLVDDAEGVYQPHLLSEPL